MIDGFLKEQERIFLVSVVTVETKTLSTSELERRSSTWPDKRSSAHSPPMCEHSARQPDAVEGREYPDSVRKSRAIFNPPADHQPPDPAGNTATYLLADSLLPPIGGGRRLSDTGLISVRAHTGSKTLFIVYLSVPIRPTQRGGS